MNDKGSQQIHILLGLFNQYSLSCNFRLLLILIHVFKVYLMTALVDKICTMPGSVNITLCMLQGVWA